MSGFGVIDQAVPLQSAEQRKYLIAEFLPDFVMHFVQIGFIAQQHQVSTAQISLAWALQRGFAVIPSSTKREHLMSNLKAQEIQLSTEEMMAITQLDRNQREVSPEGLAPIWD